MSDDFDDEITAAAERFWRVIEEARSRMTEDERMVADFRASEIWLKVRAKASLMKSGANN